ncbi:MAG: NADH-ubiquinone oxidoreductase, chain 4L [Methanomicrobiales archaeon 53_19]|jgi:multicomponent Na+:H+ antiporter subunit C|uniref:sodium:proton antiporter n=1 Tax=Methanocalculus sp. TaxID=2004547 RepID=UPI0007476BFC|nr:sodium:proton antiporter [Methanocalculus sp.]KUK70652.1 MAG: NADH-ubiquinone oxidoreductase, chain 4L [Methanocalculus sp. 52_23]KUL03269.1 MAG: NADH-ubiquinone oxidoreductase, chain 4L [Methanomicrobiales archaeon 53_19]HIJ07274.1 cation:proton antiporter [Methanocalculus sp.]
MIEEIPYLAVVLIAGIGIATILLKKNLIKMIMGLAIIEGAANLFLVTLGYREGGIAPIFTNNPGGEMVLPTVQAMTLTNIVIGFATSALLLAFAIMIYRRYGSVETKNIRRLRE